MTSSLLGEGTEPEFEYINGRAGLLLTEANGQAMIVFE